MARNGGARKRAAAALQPAAAVAAGVQEGGHMRLLVTFVPVKPALCC